ncbi:hypothetical protein A9502_30300 [Klebsiella pneumoniae]|nr:hypothetical protein A9502_30300 [Klebsiella pneumoniae]
MQRELLDAAIDAKIALSDAQSVSVNVAGWQGEITRDRFSELIAPLVKRTLLACRRALKDAGVEANEVRTCSVNCWMRPSTPKSP